MQKMIRFAGKLSSCPGCGRQPLLCENYANNKFHFECQPCLFRLYPMPTAQQAVEVWEDLKRPEPISEFIADAELTDTAQAA